MGVNIESGGHGNSSMVVDNTGRGWTRSISSSEVDQATLNGDAYNINTGEVSISADTAILYFKNGETQDFFIDSIAAGFTDATQSDIQKITVIKNPTGGTVISGVTPVAMNENRNFGSSKTLSNSLAYVGASGETATGGSDVALFFQQDNNRLFATVGFALKQGNSVAIELDVSLDSGSVGVYAAIIGHLVPTLTT